MVHVLDAPRPQGFLNSFLSGLSSGLPKGIAQMIANSQELKKEQEKNAPLTQFLESRKRREGGDNLPASFLEETQNYAQDAQGGETNRDLPRKTPLDRESILRNKLGGDLLPQEDLQEQAQQKLTNKPAATVPDPTASLPKSPPHRKGGVGSTAEERMALALGGHEDVAKVLAKEQQMADAPHKESIQAEIKRSDKYLEGISDVRSGLKKKALAMEIIGQAIRDRKPMSSLQSQLAETTGLELFRDATGAQMLSATKTFFLSDLASLSARNNQFLEKILSESLTHPSRVNGANEIVKLGMDANLALDQAKVEMAGKFENFYRENWGYVPSRIDQDIEKAMEPIAQDIQDTWSYKAQKLQEAKKTDAQLLKLPKVGPGTMLTGRMAQLLVDKYKDPQLAENAAKKLGYTIPPEHLYDKLEQQE